MIHVPVRKSRRASAPQTDKARKFRKKPLLFGCKEKCLPGGFPRRFHFGQRFEMREGAERIKSICPGFLGENRAEEVILCYSGFGQNASCRRTSHQCRVWLPSRTEGGLFRCRHSRWQCRRGGGARSDRAAGARRPWNKRIRFTARCCPAQYRG